MTRPKKRTKTRPKKRAKPVNRRMKEALVAEREAEEDIVGTACSWYNADAGNSEQNRRQSAVRLYDAVMKYMQCRLLVEQLGGRLRA
jgi:hypothetical protein